MGAETVGQHGTQGASPPSPKQQSASLEDLLQESLSRTDELIYTQSRMRGLLDAVMSVAEDLSLEAVLDRVVRSACRLVGARYGALGVLGEDGMLSHFITVGIDGQTAANIGALPTGHGVLGLLSRERRPLRLHDLRQHAASRGFPPEHPQMVSFLGVPVRVREEIFGYLYLTEKNGGTDFSPEDEELAVALAAAAGVAIENARLFEEGRRRQLWREASMEVSGRMMGRGPDLAGGALDLIAERALHVTNAAVGIIAVPGENTAALDCAAVVGQEAARLRDRKLEVGSAVITGVLANGGAALARDAAEVLGSELAAGLGPSLVAALGPAGPNRGLLILVLSNNGAFHPVDEEMSAIFGSHVALAIELARAHKLREELAVFKDRDRIAMDLHDVVIQRLFAAGLSMQSLRRFTSEPKALERISAVTGELDETIRELRTTIYSLRADTVEKELLSSRILRTIQEGAKSIPFTPRLRLSGGIDAVVPEVVGDHLLAVLSEGLSNAVRHAAASSIDISVAAEADHVQLVLSDDGRGFSDTVQRSGLANMESRAKLLGGSLDIDSSPRVGTRLVWWAPLE